MNQVDEAVHAWEESARKAVEFVIREMMPPIKQMHESMVSAGVIPAPIPTDPRERALYLRKHRNTGPGKPIQKQRRKR